MRVTELNSKLNSPFSVSELMWSVVCQCNERIEFGRSRTGYRRQYIKLRNFLATRYRLLAQSIKLSGHRRLLLARIILDRTTVWKKICIPQIVLWNQLVVKNYFEELSVGVVPIQARYFQRFSYHSCNYSISIGW